MTSKLGIFLGVASLAFALDMLTKIWVDMSLSYADRVPVIDGFFYLTHVRNTGAAFGLFAGQPEPLRLGFFISVTLVAIALMISFYRNLAPGDRLSALALGMILGGTLGNLTDRVFRGEVVDFLHFRLWTGYSWPDFNLADSFIVVGVGLLIIELLASESEERAEPEAS